MIHDVFENSLCVTLFLFFLKTIRISTMHVLRMIVAKAEETHELRVNFVLCFSTFIFLQQTENLLLPLETRSLNAQHPASRSAVIAVVSLSTLPPCENPLKFTIHNFVSTISRLPHHLHCLFSLCFCSDVLTGRRFPRSGLSF